MASTTPYSEKSNFDPIMEQTDTNEDPNSGKKYLSASVFDTPKTSLSRSTTRDQSSSPPARPCPAVRPPKGLLRLDTNATQPDLEKGYLSAPPSATRDGAPSPLYSPCREYSISNRVKECSKWPSRQTLKCKARQEKSIRRGSNFFGLSRSWGDLTKKQKLLIKILIVLLVIGIAVGVAIGISKAVGGGVYAGQSRQKQIPGSH